MKNSKVAALLGTVLLGSAVAVGSLPGGAMRAAAAGTADDAAQAANAAGDVSAERNDAAQDAAAENAAQEDPSASDTESSEERRGADDGTTTADPASNKAAADDTEYETIHISTVYELEEAADQSHFDKWSRNKRIVLDNDLDLAGTSFRFGSFGGIFDGQNHTISGFAIGGKTANAGFFEIIQDCGLVENLHLSGTVRPSGTQSRLGGIAGVNNGTISSCSFDGSVSADTQVGGIAGRNETSGIIENCSASGDVTGRTYTGGIAGYNAGTLTSCSNDMAVNTTYSDSTVSMDQISDTVENILMTGRINSTENIQARTDSGGVAGYSSGVIYSCTNTGEVGYEHVGYNVGGVAGRSSGFLKDCQNSGTIKGRKDVGGVVGQQQPYLRLQFSGNTLDTLEDQINGLKSTADGILGSANHTSGNVSMLLGQVSSLASGANDNVKTIADEARSEADSAADQLSSASDSLNDALDQTQGVVAEVGQQVDALSAAATNLNSTLDAYMEELNLSDSDRNSVRSHYDSLRSSISKAQDAAKDLNSLVTDVTNRTVDRVKRASDDIRSIVQNLHQAARDAAEILEILDDPQTVPGQDANGTDSALREEMRWKIEHSELYQDMKTLQKDLENVLDAFAGLQDSASQVAGDVQQSLDNGELPDREQISNDIDQNVLTQFQNSVEALRREDSDISGRAADLLADQLKDLADTLSGMKALEQKVDDALTKAAEELYGKDGNGGILNEKTEDGKPAYNFDFYWPLDDDPQKRLARDVVKDDMDGMIAEQGKIKEAITDLQALNEELEKDPARIKDETERIRSDINTVVDGLANIGNQAASLMDIMSSHLNGIQDPEQAGVTQAIQNVINVLDSADDVTAKTQNILGTLAGIDSSVNHVSDTVTQAGNNLYASVNDMISVIQALNNEVSGSASSILSQAQDLNSRIDDIVHTLEDALEKDTDAESDSLTDDSEIDYTDMTQGRTTGSTNRGKVQADNNVGGVVGTVGVEYDLDPERDIQEAGSASLDYNLFARAVIDNCVNEAEIESKNNYCGGIAAHMELGYADACQNYGKIAGGADYSGGISGYSNGTIHGCYAKCDVSGGRYVGGIVGYGTKVSDNTSMISVSSSTQYTGAIAGAVKDVNRDVTGNVFVADNLRGIDGISYDGIAQGTTYAKIRDTDASMPEEYSQIFLTFTADDETVSVLKVPYGSDVTEDQLPEVPAKDGFAGRWEKESFHNVTRDASVKAVYTRILDIVSSSAARQGGAPVLLAEGSFAEEDVLGMTPVQTQDGETERWRVVVPEETAASDAAAETEPSQHTFRYLPVDGSTENTTLYLVSEDGSRQKLDTGTNGKYLTFTADGNDFTFAAETGGHDESRVIAVGTAVGVAAVVSGLLAARRRRKHRKV